MYKTRIIMIAICSLVILGASPALGQTSVEVTVQDAAELKTAIDDANAGSNDVTIIINVTNGTLALDTITPSLPELGTGTNDYIIQAKNGDVTIEGYGTNPIFTSNALSPLSTVTFENINFKGGNASAGASGGVFNYDTQESLLRFAGDREIFFVSNSADKYGGVFFFDGPLTPGDPAATSDQVVQFGGACNVLFEQNTARGSTASTNSNTPNGDGGGVFHGGELVFYNQGMVTFQSNVATASGGVSWDGISKFSGNVGDVVFRENTAGTITVDGYGGVNYHGYHYYENNNVLFDKNKASASGGVIAFGESHFANMGDVVFQHNEAYGSGGAISQGEQSFYNTGKIVFDNNISTTGNGGAIEGGTQKFLGYDLSTEFINNYAIQGNGGAISSGIQEFTTYSNVLFQGNMAHGYGGAYYGTATAAPGPILTLAPVEGRIEFIGNKQGVTFDVNGNPDVNSGEYNSLYLNNLTTVNLNPDSRAEIRFYDPIESADINDGGTPLENKIIMDGPGTVRLWGTSNYRGITEIHDGRFLLMDFAKYGEVGTFQKHEFLIDGGQLGFSVDRNLNHSQLITEKFTVAGTPGIFVVGVSTLDAEKDYRFEDVITSNNSTSIDAQTDLLQEYDNGLMEAKLEKNGQVEKNADLVVRVHNMSDVLGVDPIYDLIRQTFDNEDINGFFDEIYHNGGGDLSSLDGFVQTVGGGTVRDSLHGARIFSNSFQRMIYHRLDRMRRCDDYCFLGRRISEEKKRRNMSSYDIPTRKHLWADFSYESIEYSPANQTQGFRFRPSFFAVGYDRRVNDWTYGIAGLYGYGKLKGGSYDQASVGIDQLMLGIYAERIGRRYYVRSNARFGVGWNKEKTFFPGSNDPNHASFNSATVGCSLDVGRTFCLGQADSPWELTVHTGAEYSYLMHESFTEDGPQYQRRFGSAKYNVAEIPVGLRIAKRIEYANGSRWFSPQIDLVYARSVADKAPGGQMGFLSNQDMTVKTKGTSLEPNIFRLRMGVLAHCWQHADLGFGYNLETRKNYSDHQINMSLVLERP